MNNSAPVWNEDRKRSTCRARPVRLLALLEANSVTGPAKAFIEFCGALQPTAPSINISALDACVVTFERPGEERLHRSGRAALERALESAAIRHSPIPERFRFDTRVISALKTVTRSFQTDIIESHSVKSHALVWASGIWRRIPWLAYHHGYTCPDIKARAYNCVDGLSLRAADRVITVAAAFAPALARRGVQRDRLRVIQNALTPSDRPGTWSMRTARQMLGLPDSVLVVLSLGRLSHEKGMENLVRAFAALIGRQTDAMLVIAGEGPEHLRLVRLARAAGISDRTRFVGHILDPSPYLAAADVFAMPSLSEGSSYALLEALAAGVPVVATSAGGIPETVTNGVTAIIVPPGDSSAMADAIGRLFQDRPLRAYFASNGRVDIARKFSPILRAGRILDLYAEVLEERNNYMEESR